MYLSIRCLCALFLLSSAAAHTALAQRGPLAARVSGIPDAGSLKTPFSVAAYLPGLGRVRLSLNREAERGAAPAFTTESGAETDPSSIRLFRGRVQRGKAGAPAAASLFEVAGAPHLFAAFTAPDRRGASRHYRLAVRLDGARSGTAHLSRTSPYARMLLMDNDLLQAADARRLRSSGPRDLSRPLIIELNLDADAAWYGLYGSESNSFISTFVNEARAIYESQLGITFRVVRQNVFKKRNFGGQSAESRITSYQSYTSSRPYFKSADTHHLFSGSRITHGVIGISYVGAVCISPYQSFALTQHSTPAFVPITFAHELAHNLGARHDDSSTSIMNSVLGSPPPERFSPRSSEEIHGFLQFYGSCLQEQTAYAAEIPISLAVSVNPSGAFSAAIGLDGPYPDCTVTLLGSAKRSLLFDAGHRLASYRPESAERRLSARIPHPSLLNDAPAPIFLGAAISCPDGRSGRSRVRTAATDRIAGGRGLPLSKWFGRLAHLL